MAIDDQDTWNRVQMNRERTHTLHALCRELRLASEALRANSRELKAATIRTRGASDLLVEASRRTRKAEKSD
jgi:hypothetical protein